MFFTREKSFKEKLINCLDLYSDYSQKILSNISSIESLEIEKEKINKKIFDLFELLYYDSFIPLLRGDYFDVISNLSCLVENLYSSIAFISNQTEEIKTSINNEYIKTNLLKLIEIIKQVSDSYKEDNWNIKMIHIESKKRIIGLRKELDKYIKNNSSKLEANTVYILYIRYVDTLDKFFNSIAKPIIRIQY
jgi:hypothetical protein